MTTQGISTGTTTGGRAEQLRSTVADQSGQVAGTAKDQAREVATEATERGRDLAREARSQVREQTDAQRERLAGTLHRLGDELRSMASSGDGGPGIAAELAGQAAGRVHQLGDYVEKHQPGDLLDDVRAFARRRPGTFLLAAAAAGVLAGRLTRGVTAAVSSDGGGAYPPAAGPPPSGTSATSSTPATSATTAPSAAPAARTTPATTGAGPATLQEEVDVIAVEPEDSPRRFRGELP